MCSAVQRAFLAALQAACAAWGLHADACRDDMQDSIETKQLQAH